jgi:3-oxoacyl-[acyl-carrier protein] reductase
MAGIRLDGSVVVVTGASRGLGRSMALAFADAGAKVVLASPELPKLEELAREIVAQSSHEGRTSAHQRVMTIATDITSQSDCERLLAESIERLGGLDVLVNNARLPHRGPGIPEQGISCPFWEADPAVWQEAVRINVSGTFLISHVVAPHMIKKGWGRIINITTSLDTMQRRHNSPYGVTKAALEAATLIWAHDLADTGVTCNSLIPGGRVATEPDRAPPPGRSLLPVDVMNAAAIWLASPLSDGVTGKRYVGKLWDASLPPAEAAARALEPPVLREPKPSRD